MEKKSILVIDDEEIIRKSLNKALKLFNYDVETAKNFEEADEKSKLKNYDVILSDIRMPKMDGIETLKRIPRSGKKLLMTAFSNIYNETCGIKCLMKPFEIKDLLNAIEN